MYYNKNTTLYLNGKFIKAVDATTDLYSQTLHYGYGVFEGIRAYQTIIEVSQPILPIVILGYSLRFPEQIMV